MTEVHIPVLPKLPVVKNAFVIYDPKTERYSSGGMDPWWSKKMKYWKSWGSLKNHLAMFITINYTDLKYAQVNKKYGLAQNNPYEDCMIYDISTNTYVCRVKDLYNEMFIAREEQDKKDQKKQLNEMMKKIKKMNGEA
jgi:hypothetical protein